jgi:hypothetical protein
MSSTLQDTTSKHEDGLKETYQSELYQAAGAGLMRQVLCLLHRLDFSAD